MHRSASDRYVGGIVFSGHASMSACVRPGMCPVSTITPHWVE